MSAATLAEFVTARLDEDEAVAASLVIPPHYDYKPHPALSRWEYHEDGEVEYEQAPEMREHPYPDHLYVTCDSEGLTPSVDPLVGRHIARHDPARVLATVAAHRAIVEACTMQSGTRREQVAKGRYNIIPALVPLDEMGGDVILPLLASIWADHPDFDEQWRT